MDVSSLPADLHAGERTAYVTDAEDLEYLLGSGTQCIQLSSGTLRADLSSARAGSLRLFAHECNRALEIRRNISSGMLCIVYDELTDGVRAINNSQLDLIARAGSELLWIDVDLPQCPPALRHELERLTANRSLWVSAQSAAAVQLRGHVDLLLQISREQLDERLEEDLLMRIVRVVEAARDISMASRERKALALIRSVEGFMWEHVDEPITLQRICDYAGCRMRSLIYSFKDVFGVGPITYLKILRLNEAHRRLRETHGVSRIFDVAASLGFWHMGHFSADYKRLFGTTASETAGRKPTPRFKSRIAQRP
jgi:AraC-like DNA-binding protein